MKLSFLPRKDDIILSAIEIIDELGINKLSTRELAKRQNVTDASLYRHFNCKQEILLAVLEYYSKFDDSIFKTVENSSMKTLEGIRFIVGTYAQNYENYPATTAILQSYDILMYEEKTSEKIKEIFNNRISHLENIIKDGQAKGEINKQFTCEQLSSLITGIIRTETLKWRINDRKYKLKQTILETLESLLNTCAIARG